MTAPHQRADLVARYDAAMAAAGLDPPPDERRAILEMYAGLESAIEALHALEAARVEAPALTFSARPPDPGWR
jgi:hypothetical protein